MGKRKEKPKYTADDLKALKQRMEDHRIALAEQIADLAVRFQQDPEFYTATAIRDKADCLASTMFALSNIGMYIENSERDGPQSFPCDLVECGLEGGTS